MNRQEFMDQLAYLLGDLQSEDRDEAVQYYNDYFDDAGEENEQEVISELGSPEKVAAMIRQDMLGADPLAGEFTESGYTDARFRDYREIVPAGGQTSGGAAHDAGSTYNSGSTYSTGSAYNADNTYSNGSAYDTGASYGNTGSQPKQKKEMNTATKIVIGACIVLGALVLLPAAGGIAGGVVGVLAAICAALLSVAGAGIALIVSGVIGFFTGVAGILSRGIGTGLFYMGGSLIAVACGILLTMFGVWLLSKIIPGIIRGIVSLVQKIFRKKEVDR